MSERHPSVDVGIERAPAHPPTPLPQRITIREVGSRDGLQAEEPMPVEQRAGLIDMLGGANLPKIEAVSFVSPKAVPAMADAAEVWKQVRKRDDVQYSALVPNRREPAQERRSLGERLTRLEEQHGTSDDGLPEQVRLSLRVEAPEEVLAGIEAARYCCCCCILESVLCNLEN